jgi:hypothetical protein
LKERLLADKQVLEWDITKSGVQLKGTVVDDSQAQTTGHWSSGGIGKYVGAGYQHDGNANKGEMTATFSTKLPKSGNYEVRIAYSALKNRATNVPVTIRHAGAGEVTVKVNQRETPSIDGITQSLGVFPFSTDQPATVIISNAGTDGHVLIDAIQWLHKDN